MIRSVISRDTCINHHVTNVQHGSACSCTTLNYCTTWLVVFKYNNIQLQLRDNPNIQLRTATTNTLSPNVKPLII